ncbi:MAG: hypothetical protein J6X94_06960 [Lachnospiraceae bacterium]|nr:hypothetical protein [Lachnospiraceae bacterium]
MGVIKVKCVILNNEPLYIEVDIMVKDTVQTVSFIAFLGKNPVFSGVCGHY